MNTYSLKLKFLILNIHYMFMIYLFCKYIISVNNSNIVICVSQLIISFLTFAQYMNLFLPMEFFKNLLPLLAIIAGIFVISTKNPIISVFNLIVLYILVAFYLIFIGINYLGLSYIIIYIGAIAILFLFIIMIIDVEVVEKKSNNYLPLLLFLLCGFLFTFKNILFNLGLIKFKSLSFNEEKVIIDDDSSSYLFYSSFLNNNQNIINDDYYKYIENNDKEINIKSERNNFNFINNFKDIDKLTEKLNINIEDSYPEYQNISKDNKLISNFNLNSNLYIAKMNNIGNNVISINTYYNNTGNIGSNYLLISSDWDSAVNRLTQITGVGDILYSVYHSYIYILSVILLLGMIGAIILTADNYHEIRVINIYKDNKTNSLFKPFFHLSRSLFFFFTSSCFKNKSKTNLIIPFFYQEVNTDLFHSEGLLGNLLYFVLFNILIGILLLSINSYFSLSIKYLDKEGGFECGFTSFVQTRERFNVIFYRVSLLFLIFDLEIILAFPYTAILQKNQNISKNNLLAFLYILIIGFIYELKEGALNIVKKPHATEININ